MSEVRERGGVQAGAKAKEKKPEGVGGVAAGLAGGMASKLGSAMSSIKRKQVKRGAPPQPMASAERLLSSMLARVLLANRGCVCTGRRWRDAWDGRHAGCGRSAPGSGETKLPKPLRKQQRV